MKQRLIAVQNATRVMSAFFLGPHQKSKSNYIEISADELCPCSNHKKSHKRLIYGECCKKRRTVRWERDIYTGELFRSMIIRGPDIIKSCLQFDEMRNQEPERAEFMKKARKPDIQNIKKNVLFPLLQLRICDPCYFYCICIGTDFIPNEWRYILDKKERMLRKQEWNDAIEVYIKYRYQMDYYEIMMDDRPPRRIRRWLRIGRYGTLERQRCLNCGKREKYESEFKLCKQCEIGKYCSRKCQKMHWVKHKQDCQVNNVRPQTIPNGEICRQAINMMPVYKR